MGFQFQYTSRLGDSSRFLEAVSMMRLCLLGSCSGYRVISMSQQSRAGVGFLRRGSWLLLLSLFICSCTEWPELALPDRRPTPLTGVPLFPAVHPDQMGPDAPEWLEFEDAITRQGIGGFHVFRSDAANLVSVITRAQQLVADPLVVTADLEGGAGFIVRGATRFPRGMGLAATGNERLVADVADVTALEARALGIHVNFFPVVDVNTNPLNPIINLRSFGGDPTDVAYWASIYADSYQDAGGVATAKHFPGHGDTKVDSHSDLPVVNRTRQELNQVELVPFQLLIERGIGAIMSAHIALPQLSGGGSLPATLSPGIMQGLLRNELGFNGLVFTDAMDMKGITNHYSREDATLKALQAGADVILFARQRDLLMDRLFQALGTAELSPHRLKSAAERIRFVASQGPRFPDPDWKRVVGHPRHWDLARQVVQSSVTLLKADEMRWPIDVDPGSSLLVVTMRDEGNPWEFEEPTEAFVSALVDSFGDSLTHHALGVDATAADADVVLASAADADQVLVLSVTGLSSGADRNGFSGDQIRVLKGLATAGACRIALGNPYSQAACGVFDTVLIGYDYDPLHGEVAAHAAMGLFQPSGTLPVAVEGLGEKGSGIRP